MSVILHRRISYGYGPLGQDKTTQKMFGSFTQGKIFQETRCDFIFLRKAKLPKKAGIHGLCAARTLENCEEN